MPHKREGRLNPNATHAGAAALTLRASGTVGKTQPKPGHQKISAINYLRNSRHPADCASHANAPWDELRVWDPGD